ncbi:MAG TPA: hypothetical protein VMR97_09390 [Acidimicrobiales bacterium]|nr:hypothetical protein [Acidimicrobiales bacterium]
MEYRPPAVEHRQRIDDPLVLGTNTLKSGSPSWTDEDEQEPEPPG